MITLAIEQSTSRSSIALLQDRVVLADRVWDEDRFAAPRLFSAIRELLSTQSLDPNAFDGFAVGLGPGSFAGLRVSLSAARGLALPSHKPVLGVSSSEALAADVYDEIARSPITIAGDARRGRLWLVEYERCGETIRMTIPHTLVDVEELPACVREGSILATSDWHRIGEALRSRASSKCRLIQERRYPKASTVGRLTWERFYSDARRAEEAGRSAPVSPIYLHPPVFQRP
jgi:tRNA threonylcarbamoyladenosine biosynthesis protein TsaB